MLSFSNFKSVLSRLSYFAGCSRSDSRVSKVSRASLSSRNNNDEMTSSTSSLGMDGRTLVEAARRADVDAVRAILKEQKIDVNARDEVSDYENFLTHKLIYNFR